MKFQESKTYSSCQIAETTCPNLGFFWRIMWARYGLKAINHL